MTVRKSELRRAEVVDEIKAITCSVLQEEHSMTEDAAQDVADSIVDGLLKSFAGTNIYIPSRYFKEIEDRREKVESLFNGDNYAEIARALGITQRAVYKILARKRNRPLKINSP